MKRILVLLLTAAGLAVPRLFAADIVFFKGKAIDLSGGQKSLEQRFGAAEREFRGKEKGDVYLAAYSFMSRRRIDGRREKSSVPFKIAVHDRRIEIRRTWTGERYDTGDNDEGPRQAVVLFLHKMESGKSVPADWTKGSSIPKTPMRRPTFPSTGWGIRRPPRASDT